MHSLETFAAAKLAELEAQNLRRWLVETDRTEDAIAIRNGRRLISFCCNDYLNLSQHPEVKDAAIAATRRLGAGAGASRLVSGNHSLYRELETALARLKGTEDACVFGSGYLANLGIIPALAGAGDLVLADALSHACLMAGGKLSGAETLIFRHNDVAHLSELLRTRRKQYRHCLILTDGVFSMDGDLAPVSALAQAAREYDAWLMTDDAHGIGVLAEGRGSSFANDVKADVPLQMGTLSKAVGAYGGYLCASRAVIDLIRTRARTLIYSTGLPPAIVAAAIASLDIISRDAQLRAAPLHKARRFTRAMNLPLAQSPIVPLIIGDPARALALSAMLEDAGFLVTAIRPPTVPEGTARLRFTFTAAHQDADIDRLSALLREAV
ncbi:MAG TPA: 8-amino-7-oxononanoate synthase [Alphaproteobacteria bacterium]|nr:8-amino-7-oxononanoate synthase [Alphaproteobacteria bacterium]